MEQLTYRNIIQDEFKFRTKQNLSYSLRAFARDLTMSPSQLSEILNGKSGLSTKNADTIAKCLGLSKSESETFKALVEIEHGRSERIKQNAKKTLEEYKYGDSFKGLSLESFQFVSDWKYYSILSTMELDGYNGTTDFIAQKMGHDQAEIEESIELLLKLNMVKIENGMFYPSGEMYTSTHDIPSSGLKKFHKQHMKKAMDAVDEIAVELRDITSMTMAIDMEKIPEAKEMIKTFRRNLCKFMESGKKEQVYNLNIQLVPITQTQTMH